MTIFTKAGEPVTRDWWINECLAIAERKRPHRGHGTLALEVDAAGNVVSKVMRDKLGDPRKVFRAYPLPVRDTRHKYDGKALRALRAEKGVGRPDFLQSLAHKLFGRPLRLVAHTANEDNAVGPQMSSELVTVHKAPSDAEWAERRARMPLSFALTDHGSQRAAARALGLNLSTFQRRLAKEAA